MSDVASPKERGPRKGLSRKNKRLLRTISILLGAVIVVGVVWVILRPTPAERVSAALEASVPTGTIEVTVTSELAALGEVEYTGITIEGRGITDVESGTSEIDFDLRDLTNDGGALGELKNALTIYDGSETYMEFRPSPTRNRQWVHARPDDFALEQGLDVGVLRQIYFSNPSQVTALFLSTPSEAEHLEQETMDGVSVDHYRFDLSLEAPPGNPQSLTELYETLAAEGAVEPHADVWVNDDEVRRIAVSYELPIVFELEETARLSIEIELSGTASTDTIETPTDDVVELEDVFRPR